MAARRELLEETGICVTENSLIEIHEGIDAGGYLTTTYLLIKNRPTGDVFTTNEVGLVRWCNWDEILNGPFRDYNIGICDLFKKNSHSRYTAQQLVFGHSGREYRYGDILDYSGYEQARKTLTAYELNVEGTDTITLSMARMRVKKIEDAITDFNYFVRL